MDARQDEVRILASCPPNDRLASFSGLIETDQGISVTFEISRARVSSPPVLIPLLGIALAVGVLAALGYGVSVYAVALPYAVGFMALVYVRPDLAFALILASAPFNYDLGLGPAKVALSDISLVLALPVLLLRVKNPLERILHNPVLPAVSAYLLVCILSILANGDPAEAITSMVQMVMYLIVSVFVFSACLDNRQIIYSALYGLLASCVFLAILKLSTDSLDVLTLNKNSVGTSLSYGVLVAVELWIARHGRQRRLLGAILAVLLAGLLATLSRGAWLGSLGGIMLILLLRRQLRLFVQVAALAVPILVLCWVLLPQQAKDYASDLNVDSHNVKARLDSIDLAYSIFGNNPVLGTGVGLRKEYDATNVVMSTLAETGVVGLVAFLCIYASFGWAVWRARWRIPITSPLFPLLAIGSALVLCHFLHGMVDHFWSRGTLPAWAGMGMALNVCAIVAGRGRR